MKEFWKQEQYIARIIQVVKNPELIDRITVHTGYNPSDSSWDMPDNEIRV